MAKRDRLKLTTCTTSVIGSTIQHLREHGSQRCESVVLWLGKRAGQIVEVIEVYQPMQLVESHMFHIPPEGMDRLQARLRQDRLIVAAQVHTHPNEAFHSYADDRWAIVRHEGALSLVVPYFASQTTTANFLDNTKVFRLSADNDWIEVPADGMAECLIIN